MSLETVFNFTADDLVSNAKGQLTARQQDLLKSYRKVSGCGTVIALVVVIGTIGGMAALILLNADTESSVPPEAMIAIGGVFGFAILLFLIFWLWGIYRARYVRNPKVFEVTGIAQPHLKKRKNYAEYQPTLIEYYLKIGKVQFQLQNKNQYEAIQADMTYRVHYVHYPPTHIILSIEPR